MVESSRLFLFTEYARKGCGTIETRGTDYKVWDGLPVSSRHGSSYILLLTSFRIAFPPIRELRNYLPESKTTRLPRRRDLHHTILVASRTVQTLALQMVFMLKNSKNT